MKKTSDTTRLDGVGVEEEEEEGGGEGEGEEEEEEELSEECIPSEFFPFPFPSVVLHPARCVA